MNRGQIHTLEAFVAALLIVGALLFASQATAVTPLSASTSNQHIENQQRAMASDLLAITADNRTLHEAMTYWNASADGDDPSHFRHAAEPNRTHYTDVPPAGNPLRAPLIDAFEEGVHAYNIELVFRTPSGDTDSILMVRMGTPSDNAVTATETIVLFDDDPFSWESGNPTYENISEARNTSEDDFWAPDLDEEATLYTVVEVRITVWRM